MRKNIIILIVVTLFAISLSAQNTDAVKPINKTAVGHDCPEMMMQGRHDMIPGNQMMNMNKWNDNEQCMKPDLWKELKLDAAQTKALESLKTNQIKQMNLLKAEMENLHIDFQVAMKNAEYAKAKEIAKAIGTKKTEMMIKNIEHQEQIMNLLNDKQKETYKELFRPEILVDQLRKFDLQPGIITHTPMENLVKYHLHRLS